MRTAFRRVARMAAVVGGITLLLGGLPARAGDHGAHEDVGNPGEPTVLESRGGTLTVKLVASRERIRLNGEMVWTKVYNRRYVGPTLVVSPGDTLDLTLVNRLDQMTNLHFHGMFVSPRADSDNIFRMVHPGQTAHYIVKIPSDESPGLYWYHPHMHGLVEPQIFGGMSGLIVVKGINSLLPPRLRGIEQHMLALKDFQVEHGKIPQVNIDSGAPTTRTVNGHVDPRFTIAPGETQLWRIANIGADIWYDVKLPGIPFVVIGQDANPVWKVWTAKHLVMPPGQRFEVLVTGRAARTTHLITRAYDQGTDGDRYPKATLATVKVEGSRVPRVNPPDGLVPNDSLVGAPIARTRHIVFSEDPTTNEFYIDGKRFSPTRIDVTPTKDTAERWVIKNISGEQHPFHIHINDFQVIKVNGERVPLRGGQDVIELPEHGSVVMLTEFRRFTGKYVFHCHIVAHEDNGMMATVKVEV